MKIIILKPQKNERELPKLSGTLQIRAYVTCIFLHSGLRWRWLSGTVGRDLYTDVRKQRVDFLEKEKAFFRPYLVQSITR